VTDRFYGAGAPGRWLGTRPGMIARSSPKGAAPSRSAGRTWEVGFEFRLRAPRFDLHTIPPSTDPRREDPFVNLLLARSGSHRADETGAHRGGPGSGVVFAPLTVGALAVAGPDVGEPQASDPRYRPGTRPRRRRLASNPTRATTRTTIDRTARTTAGPLSDPTDSPSDSRPRGPHRASDDDSGTRVGSEDGDGVRGSPKSRRRLRPTSPLPRDARHHPSPIW
jgi:hypothetical protein